MPGRCVEPSADARSRLGPDAEGDLQIERSVDLDGDGAADPFVTHASFCGTGGCTWHLYVVRGSCAHHVGELFGLLPIARTASHGGLAELEIVMRDGCGGMARTETRVRFEGTAYVPYSTRRCRCPGPEDDPSEAEDPERLCEPWAPAVPAPE